jgi:hypothetical protein
MVLFRELVPDLSVRPNGLGNRLYSVLASFSQKVPLLILRS